MGQVEMFCHGKNVYAPLWTCEQFSLPTLESAEKFSANPYYVYCQQLECHPLHAVILCLWGLGCLVLGLLSVGCKMYIVHACAWRSYTMSTAHIIWPKLQCGVGDTRAAGIMPITQSCNSIDMYIWGRGISKSLHPLWTVKCFPLPTLCSPKYFMATLFQPPPYL